PSFLFLWSILEPLNQQAMDISLGNTGRKVRTLNGRLARKGFLAKDPDDKFDFLTQNALLDLQTLLNVEPTGQYSEYMEEMLEQAEMPLDPPVHLPRPLVLGDRSIYVYLLRKKLSEKGLATLEEEGDNFFDQDTLNGVQQLINGKQTVDQKCWSTIFEFDQNQAGFFYPEFPPLFQNLFLGVENTNVLILHEKLYEKGFLAGKREDEIFDVQTREAVRTFQGAAGLQVDGIVGQNTWYALLGVDLNMIHFSEWFNQFIRRSPYFNFGIQNVLAFAEAMADYERIYGKENITLNEFIGHFCIIYNETGGTFRPLTEFGPNPRNPADFANDAYFFESIPSRKLSYNQNPNIPAGNLLKSWGVIDSLEDIQAWNSTTQYPWDQPDEVKNRARDCDFFRFRGRGLNQVTWRNNYLAFADPAIPDQEVIEMSNAELDAAFQQPDVFCRVFNNYISEPNLAAEAIPALIRGDFTIYPRYVAGVLATQYHQLYINRAEALKAAILENGQILSGDSRIIF
ncbi:MAG: peptidoglycan-binding protein, partial [Bacteroidota bacterium]